MSADPGITIVGKHPGAPGGAESYAWVGWARTEEGLQDLWGSFRLEGEPPALSGQAVLLAATGESSSCPSRLTDATVEDDVLHLSLVEEPAVSPAPDNYACTADFNPVTFVLRLERDLMERVNVVAFLDTEIPLAPAGQIASMDDD